MRKSDATFIDLCDEIDELKDAVSYWKQMYENERDASIKQMNERFEETKKGVGQALMFALSVRDNEDGSLSISKEDRKQLAKNFK